MYGDKSETEKESGKKLLHVKKHACLEGDYSVEEIDQDSRPQIPAPDKITEKTENNRVSDVVCFIQFFQYSNIDDQYERNRVQKTENRIRQNMENKKSENQQHIIHKRYLFSTRTFSSL
jgi:hypothetical protein